MKEKVLTIEKIEKVKSSKTGTRRIYFNELRWVYETRPTALILSLNPGDKVIFNKSKHILKPTK